MKRTRLLRLSENLARYSRPDVSSCFHWILQSSSIPDFPFPPRYRSLTSWPNQVQDVNENVRKKRFGPAEHSTQGLNQRSQKPDFILQPTLYMTFNFLGLGGLDPILFILFICFQHGVGAGFVEASFLKCRRGSDRGRQCLSSMGRSKGPSNTFSPELRFDLGTHGAFLDPFRSVQCILGACSARS